MRYKVGNENKMGKKCEKVEKYYLMLKIHNIYKRNEEYSYFLRYLMRILFLIPFLSKSLDERIRNILYQPIIYNYNIFIYNIQSHNVVYRPQEEDKNLSGEELGKKLDRLLKQSEEQLQKLNHSSKQLRAHIFGQDRYWRRYWELACAGGIFVEAMESAEPEVLELQAELDEKYKNMPVEEKAEAVKQEDAKTNTENRENEAPNSEVKEEKKHNSSEQNEDVKSLGDKEKPEVEEINCKKEPVQNCGSENLENAKELSEKRNDMDSTMTDAKTNVTSEEIKQETEVVNMDVDMKKENEETDEETTKPVVVKTMEDKIVETIPNGDKFNHVNNLHNGKELNGTFISSEFSWAPRRRDGQSNILN